MKQRNQILVCLSAQMLLSFTGFAGNSAIAAPQASPPQAAVKAQINVSGPYCSQNLAVYLIRGPQKLKGPILTLEEALAKKQVIVEETSDVNRLSIQNLSNSPVFLQSGDIVRGGKQDRAVQFDMMLQPKSGKVPLPCFCVEHGRWQQRGMESSDAFSSSPNQLSSKDLKLAAKKIGDQGAVWNNVSAVQNKLTQKVRRSVCSSTSPTSLELTLDSDTVKSATKQHLLKLSNIAKGQSDVIGYAFAINGKINSADVYASNELFTKLWPKLLKSSAAEAIAESQTDKSQPPPAPAPAPALVKQFLSDAESKPIVKKAGDKQYEMTEQESAKSIMYKTKWFAAPHQMQVVDERQSINYHGSAALPKAPMPDVHTNYINK